VRLFVHGIGHFHPDGVIDNPFLESLDIGTSREWISNAVGIRTRHTSLPLDYIRHTRNADPREGESIASPGAVIMAANAARMALARAGLTASDIGLVVAGSSSPCMAAPAVACLVAAELDIAAPAFDINAACSSFAAHVFTISRWCADDTPDFVLCVYPENLTRTVDYRDRSAAVLMGDAAAACVVSTRVPGDLSISQPVFSSDPSGWRKVRISPGGFLQQDGRAVQAFAIRRMLAVLKQLQQDSGEIFIGHQANLRMLEAVCAQAAVRPGAHLANVDRRGNCGGAGVVSVLSEHWDTLRAMSEAACVAIVGAGLSWGGFRLAATRQA